MLFRLLGTVLTLLGVVVLAFLLTRLLPGDPAVAFANSPTADATTIAALRAQLGLDQPVWRQFLLHLQALARGDLGVSITTGQPVLRDLLQRLPASLELALAGFALAAGMALPLGIAAAQWPGGLADRACTLLSTLGLALPTFVTGLLLIQVFYAQTGIAPEPTGRLPPFGVAPPTVTGFLLLDTLLAGRGFREAAAQLVLPALTMAIFVVAPLARMTRAALREVLGAGFIRAARAQGLGWRQVVLSYGLRNAALPILAMAGLTFTTMLGANVLVERVFAWPGLGAYALEALLGLDYAPVQGFLLLMAAAVLLVNLLVDALQALVDPRAGLPDDA